MTYTILGAPVSPFVRKTRVAMAEKQIAYTLDPVSPFRPPEGFLDISPLKKIPVLKIEEGGVVRHLADSSVICAYLENKHPQPPLLPKDPYERARALWFEEYADSEFASQVGGGVFRPVAFPLMSGKEPDMATAKETVAEKLPKFFDYLNKEIGSNDFLVGNAFSLADIAVATQFVNLAHCGFKPDAVRWPDLARLVNAVHARPSFKAVISEESAFFESLKKR